MSERILTLKELAAQEKIRRLSEIYNSEDVSYEKKHPAFFDYLMKGEGKNVEVESRKREKTKNDDDTKERNNPV